MAGKTSKSPASASTTYSSACIAQASAARTFTSTSGTTGAQKTIPIGLVIGHEFVGEIADAVEAENNRPIGILVDLQGPKLRLGTFKEAGPRIEKARNCASISIPRPARQARAPAPSGNLAAQARRLAVDRRRQGARARERSRRNESIIAGRSRRQSVEPQRRSLPDTVTTAGGADDQGYRRP